MKLEEHQAKAVLSRFGVPVPPSGGVVVRASDTEAALKKIGEGPWVIKAQVQTGGRGKAGGIKVAKTAAEAVDAASKILGMKLVTAQTGPEGLLVKSVLVEKASPVARELYFSVALDRKKARPVIIASAQGGMDIETLAHESPEKIFTMDVDPATGLEPYQARELVYRLGLQDADSKKTAERAKFFRSCVKAFLDIDASLVEINPLAVTQANEVVALDAKIVTDDNALFRHPDLQEYEKASEQTEAERQAHAAGISYIPLTGSIGCMVNGAGLAMATMDLIKQCGGEPANFLDVGGGATVEQVTTAFKIILSDKHVKAVLINIFGGIMKCDVIAEGVVTAVKQVNLSVPLVVRLVGNRAEEGKAILAKSGLNIVGEQDLQKAAQKVVELAKKS
jgi:succinyl-CoA synthetase beta subunit